MIDLALNAIKTQFSTWFPSVSDILLHWPEPDRKIKYPYISLINPLLERQVYDEKVLTVGNDPEDNSSFSVSSVGEWRGKMDAHYFDKGVKELNAFIQLFNQKFIQNPQNGLAARSVNISYGTESYESLTLRFENYSRLSRGIGLQTGRTRQIIFHLSFSFADIVTTVSYTHLTLPTILLV